MREQKLWKKKILDSNKSDKIVNEVELIKDCSESNLQASEKEEKKTSSCDKCDFTYSNQFDLLIHKSANHPSYILNSQPEAVPCINLQKLIYIIITLYLQIDFRE